MNLKLTRVSICLALLTLVAVHLAQASFWDAIPVISQLKSVVQVVTGHTDGAKETQESFVHTAPVVSQITSASQSARGDNESARKTQKRFLHQFFEPLVENTPILGHALGVGHMIAGDKEEGPRAIKAATSSTALVLGGLVGGPVAAIAAGAVMDFLITGFDSAAHREYRAYGMKQFIDNAAQDKMSVGDIFDFCTLMGVQILVGKVAVVAADRAGLTCKFWD